MKKVLLVIISLVLPLIMAACKTDSDLGPTATPTLCAYLNDIAYTSVESFESYVGRTNYYPYVSNASYINPKKIVGEFDLPLYQIKVLTSNAYTFSYYANKKTTSKYEVLVFSISNSKKRTGASQSSYTDRNLVRYFYDFDELVQADRDSRYKPNYINMKFILVKTHNRRDIQYSIKKSKVDSIAFFNNGFEIEIQGLDKLDLNDPDMAAFKTFLDPDKYEQTIETFHGAVERHVQEQQARTGS